MTNLQNWQTNSGATKAYAEEKATAAYTGATANTETVRSGLQTQIESVKTNLSDNYYTKSDISETGIPSLVTDNITDSGDEFKITDNSGHTVAKVDVSGVTTTAIVTDKAVYENALSIVDKDGNVGATIDNGGITTDAVKLPNGDVQTQIDGLGTRLTTAENKVTGLTTSVTNLQNWQTNSGATKAYVSAATATTLTQANKYTDDLGKEVDGLGTRLSTAEGNISDLLEAVGIGGETTGETLNDRVEKLASDVTANTANISANTTSIANIYKSITGDTGIDKTIEALKTSVNNLDAVVNNETTGLTKQVTDLKDWQTNSGATKTYAEEQANAAYESATTYTDTLGVIVDGLGSRIWTIEKYFSTEEDADNKINKWNEIVEFIDGTEGTTLDGILNTFVTSADTIANALSAGTATKLSTDGGNATTPIYFKDGKPTACTYSLNATVPSDAKFTDSATTKDGHYYPANLTSATTGFTATGENFIKEIKMDNKGHVIGITASTPVKGEGADGNTTYTLSGGTITNNKATITLTGSDNIKTNAEIDLSAYVNPSLDGYAIKNHASTATTYGSATTTNYGHVKLLGGDLSGETATTISNGIAAASKHTHSQYQPKGNYLTKHQDIFNLTINAGKFNSAVTFDPNLSATTINIPNTTSHLTNDSGYITSADTVANALSATSLTIKPEIIDGSGTPFPQKIKIKVGGQESEEYQIPYAVRAMSATTLITRADAANYGACKLVAGDVNGITIFTPGDAAASLHTHGQYLTTAYTETYQGTLSGITIETAGSLSGGGTVSASTNATAGTITITGPEKLPNPNKLIIKQGGVPLGEYDGSEELTVNLASGSGEAPTIATATTGQYGIVKLVNSDLQQIMQGTGLAAGVQHTHGNYALKTQALLKTGGTISNLNVTGNLVITGDVQTKNNEFRVSDEGGNVIMDVYENGIASTEFLISDSAGTVTHRLSEKANKEDVKKLETAIEENELVTATALIDLDTQISELTLFVNPAFKKVVVASSATETTDTINGTVNGAYINFTSIGGNSSTTTGVTDYVRFVGAGGVSCFPAGGNVVISAATPSSISVTYDSGATKSYLVGSTSSNTLTKCDIYMTGNTIHGATGYYQDSDESLKTFHGDIEVDLDKLHDLPKAYFTWKADENNEMQIGTSAQEIQKLYPEIVGKDENGKLGVDYSKLSVIALKGIDKLYDRMKIMEEELKLIKEKIGL